MKESKLNYLLKNLIKEKTGSPMSDIEIETYYIKPELNLIDVHYSVTPDYEPIYAKTTFNSLELVIAEINHGADYHEKINP